MRCSGSPTISIAPERQAQPRAAGVFEALIFARLLEPLAKPLGPFGEIALGAVAQRLFVRDPKEPA
jgi:hypothetical protein